MPETDPEIIEASQEEEADPRGNDSAEVRRERETPGRALDLPEAMFPGETRKLLHGRPFDPMAVRAAIIPVEEFRMEELLPLARPGQHRFRPFSREVPEEHEDDRFRVRVVRTSRPPGFRIRRTSSMKPSGWLRCSYTSEATTLSTDPVRNGRPASAVAAR